MILPRQEHIEAIHAANIVRRTMMMKVASLRLHCTWSFASVEWTVVSRSTFRGCLGVWGEFSNYWQSLRKADIICEQHLCVFSKRTKRKGKVSLASSDALMLQRMNCPWMMSFYFLIFKDLVCIRIGLGKANAEFSLELLYCVVKMPATIWGN